MVQITAFSLDSAGNQLEQRRVPVLFHDQAEAAGFLDAYVASAYARGRGGYDPDGGYWWGREGGRDPKIHRFVIDC